MCQNQTQCLLESLQVALMSAASAVAQNESDVVVAEYPHNCNHFMLLPELWTSFDGKVRDQKLLLSK